MNNIVRCTVQIKSYNYETKERNALQTAISFFVITALRTAKEKNVCQEGLDLTAQWQSNSLLGSSVEYWGLQ